MGRTSYSIDPDRAGKARTAAGLTQQQAADELGVNRITMNRIENGRANASLELLERMAARYGVSREWLLGEDAAVDPIEVAREHVAEALAKIGDGFEELTDVLDTLNERAREKAQVAA